MNHTILNRGKAINSYYRTLNITNIDKAELLAILANLIPLFIGPITAFLVVVRFSPDVQGYYYAFGSIAALQFVIELGLGPTIIQFASHEWANLRQDVEGRILGDEKSLRAFSDLARILFRWYLISALIIIIGLGAAGSWFFSARTSHHVLWIQPWLAYCIVLGLGFVALPVFYMIQGSNQMASFWTYRLIQQAVSGIFLWLAIIFGGNLWCLSISAASTAFVNIIFVYKKHKRFFFKIISFARPILISWRNDIWPVQWRIASSTISAYFTTILFTPIIFRIDGPTLAGKVGLTVALSNVLIAVSSSSIFTKGPQFGIYVAQKKYSELNRCFWNSFYKSLILMSGGTLLLWLIAYYLYQRKYPLAVRILSPIPLALFLAASLIYFISICFSVYFRAHKREPLTAIYLISGALIGMLVYIFGKLFGIVGATGGYLAVVTLFQLPASIALFTRFRQRQST